MDHDTYYDLLETLEAHSLFDSYPTEEEEYDV